VYVYVTVEPVDQSSTANACNTTDDVEEELHISNVIEYSVEGVDQSVE
jgi:hypothetical protein